MSRHAIAPTHVPVPAVRTPASDCVFMPQYCQLKPEIARQLRDQSSRAPGLLLCIPNFTGLSRVACISRWVEECVIEWKRSEENIILLPSTLEAELAFKLTVVNPQDDQKAVSPPKKTVAIAVLEPGALLDLMRHTQEAEERCKANDSAPVAPGCIEVTLLWQRAGRRGEPWVEAGKIVLAIASARTFAQGILPSVPRLSPNGGHFVTQWPVVTAATTSSQSASGFSRVAFPASLLRLAGVVFSQAAKGGTSSTVPALITASTAHGLALQSDFLRSCCADVAKHRTGCLTQVFSYTGEYQSAIRAAAMIPADRLSLVEFIAIVLYRWDRGERGLASGSVVDMLNFLCGSDGSDSA